MCVFPEGTNSDSVQPCTSLMGRMLSQVLKFVKIFMSERTNIISDSVEIDRRCHLNVIDNLVSSPVNVILVTVSQGLISNVVTEKTTLS